jgi:hypothetical protein
MTKKKSGRAFADCNAEIRKHAQSEKEKKVNTTSAVGLS